MRKFFVPVVLALALAIPAQAAAKTKHYTGTVTPGGTIGFNVVQKPHSKKKNVSGFNFHGVPLTCAEGPKTAGGLVTFSSRLVAGTFTITASSTTTGASLQITGNLAAGTIRISGNVPIEPSGTGTNCESGTLNWTAHRG
jgi:hypothetical protein